MKAGWKIHNSETEGILKGPGAEHAVDECRSHNGASKQTLDSLGAPSARASGSSLDLARLTLARPSVSSTTMTLPVSPCALAFSPVRTACMMTSNSIYRFASQC